MEQISCPECKTKLRIFKEGVICKNNHKFEKESKTYSNFNEFNIIKKNKKVCPECNNPPELICKCKIGEKQCINNHIWTDKYYQGDKRYLCINPPDDKHCFNFS